MALERMGWPSAGVLGRGEGGPELRGRCLPLELEPLTIVHPLRVVSLFRCIVRQWGRGPYLIIMLVIIRVPQFL